MVIVVDRINGPNQSFYFALRVLFVGELGMIEVYGLLEDSVEGWPVELNSYGSHLIHHPFFAH